MRRSLLALLPSLATACSPEETTAEPGVESTPPLTLTIPPVPVEPGVEETSLCATVTVGNDETWWVDGATFRAGPGWHHSIWFTVPAGTYPARDGVWPCEEGGFDFVTVALTGGVLFAQSTQATLEEQHFAGGAALPIPAHTQVVVQLHLINSGEAPLETGASLELSRVPATAVRTPLAPMAFSYQPLAIPPGSSQVRASCDLRSVATSLHLYWVLPHYHRLGTRFSLESLPLEGTPRPVYDTTAALGEPLGGMLDPVASLDEGLRFGCDYENPTSEVVGFGPSVDDEMCIFLAFSDAQALVVGAVDEQAELKTAIGPGGVHTTDASCTVIAWPSTGQAGR